MDSAINTVTSQLYLYLSAYVSPMPPLVTT